MKKTATLLLFLLSCGCVKAQTPGGQKPLWNATVKVIDETGDPVLGAMAEMSWYVNGPNQSLISDKVEGRTDTNGVFRASHESNRSISLGFSAVKDGFYLSKVGYPLAQLNDNDPAKWNPEVTLILRNIRHPIPMYAKHVETKVQKDDESVGFDLMAGDWVAPYGKGKTSDMFFNVRRKITNDREYECDLHLTFPNNGDGIAVAPDQIAIGSDFKTPRTVTANIFDAEKTWHYSPGAGPQTVFGYFFRIRTVSDANGNVKSALYGKIAGDFRFYPGTKAPRAGFGFDYYLNPTPNDRNLEFDTAQNLIKGLPSSQQIREP